MVIFRFLTCMLLAAPLFGIDEGEILSLQSVSVVRKPFRMNPMPFVRFITHIDPSSGSPIVTLDDGSVFQVVDPARADHVFSWSVGDWISTAPNELVGNFSPRMLLENKVRGKGIYLSANNLSRAKFGEKKAFNVFPLSPNVVRVGPIHFRVFDEDLPKLSNFSSSQPISIDFGKRYVLINDEAVLVDFVYIIQDGGGRWVRAEEDLDSMPIFPHLSRVIEMELDTNNQKLLSYISSIRDGKIYFPSGLVVSPESSSDGSSIARYEPISFHFEGEDLLVYPQHSQINPFIATIVEYPNKDSFVVEEIDVVNERRVVLWTQGGDSFIFDDEAALIVSGWDKGDRVLYNLKEIGDIDFTILLIKKGIELLNLDKQEFALSHL